MRQLLIIVEVRPQTIYGPRRLRIDDRLFYSPTLEAVSNDGCLGGTSQEYCCGVKEQRCITVGWRCKLLGLESDAKLSSLRNTRNRSTIIWREECHIIEWDKLQDSRMRSITQSLTEVAVRQFSGHLKNYVEDAKSVGLM